MLQRVASTNATRQVLQKQLRKAQAPADILRVCNSFDAAVPTKKDLCSALHKLGKMRSSSPTDFTTDDGFKNLLDELIRREGTLDATSISLVAWGLAKSGARCGSAVLLHEALMRRFPKISQKLNPIEISMLAWSFGSTRVPLSDKNAELLSLQVAAKLRDFKPQEISTFVWAFAKSGSPLEPKLVEDLSTEAVSKQMSFKPQEIANLMFGLVTANAVLRLDLVQAMTAQAVRKIGQFKPRELVHLVWALAKAHVSMPAIFVKAISSEAAKQMPSFEPHEMSNLTWALAVSEGHIHPTLAQAISVRATETSERFNNKVIFTHDPCLEILIDRVATQPN
jgi:hypothetical protein